MAHSAEPGQAATPTGDDTFRYTRSRPVHIAESTFVEYFLV